jgi:large subunit ribosomal protein L9
MGDVVKVKPGFARNFLLPQKKALRATDDNRKYFDGRRKELEASNLKRRQEAEAVAAQMAGFQVVLIRQASESLQLYGSVTARDIAEAAASGGSKAVKIERSQVELPKPIKSLGMHKVQVHLHPEVVVEINANVARSADEAEFQAKGGVIMAETDRAAQEAAMAQAAAEAAAQALFEKPADPSEAEQPATEDTEEK